MIMSKIFMRQHILCCFLLSITLIQVHVDSAHSGHIQRQTLKPTSNLFLISTHHDWTFGSKQKLEIWNPKVGKNEFTRKIF